MIKLPVFPAEKSLTYSIAVKGSHPRLDPIMILVSNPYRWLLPGLALVMIMIYVDWERALIALALAGIAASITDAVNTRVLKRCTDRIRPGKQYVDIRSLGSMNHGKKSFPSNHASNTMAFALSFSLLFSGLTWYMLPLSILVGYSRIYCGAHFPFDVLAGWSHGAIWTFIIFYIFNIIHII